MQKDKIEWAIGVFEGEGNIYCNIKRRIFKMSVQMKDEDIIKRFHICVGIGRVVKRKPYRGYDPMWEWALTKTNDILDLVKLLLPLMGQRRTQQIKKAIKGKVYLKEPRKLKPILTDCGYMKKGEVSNRGAGNHTRKGEKPCPICAFNQQLYYRKWRKTFYKANT